jgi:hypothetical protein
MSFRWRLETLKEHWRDNAGNIYRSIRSRVSGSHVVALLSLAAAIGSTVATFLAWDAARNANQVSLASQALALKVYNDQIALGHPSISVLSGETNVAATRQSGYRSAEVRDYAASLVLRNSGQRDAPRAWVALSSDSFVADLSRAVLVTLPKEIDVPVRFPVSLFSAGENDSSWLLAVVYQDEVPSSGLASATEASSSQSLSVVCAPPTVFRLTSWPKEPGQDPALRVFSSGSPVTAEQVSLEWDGGEEATKRVKAVKEEVIRAAHSAKACLEVSSSVNDLR